MLLILLVLVPYIFPFLATLLQIDPITIILNQVLPVSRAVIFALGFTTLFCTAVQCCRKVGIISIIYIEIILMYLESLFLLRKKSFQMIFGSKFKTNFRFYLRSIISIQIFSNILSPMTALIFWNGVSLCVFSNFTIFRMNHVIPMPFFILFPITNIYTVTYRINYSESHEVF